MSRKSTFILGMLVLGIVHQGVSQNKVSGRITDVSNSQPVSNALIKVLDSDTGTASDSLGFFSLVVMELPVTLHISHVGYDPVYWPLAGVPKNPLEVRLQKEPTR